MTIILGRDNKTGMDIDLTVIIVLLGILTFGLICCVLFQINKDLKRYWCSLENITSIILIFLTITTIGASKNIHISVTSASIAILLASFKLFLLLGYHPNFSIYVAVFVAVLKKTLQILLVYSLLLLGFALCFYSLDVFVEENNDELNTIQEITRLQEIN